MAAYLENDGKEQDELFKQGMVKVRTLKEVKIRSFKEDNNYPSSNLGGPGNADQVIHRKDIANMGGQLTDRLAGRLHGGGLRGGYGLVIVDGARMPIGYDINFINANDVETVEYLYSGLASIYGMGAAHGVLVITTRTGSNSEPKDIQSVGILPITVQGFYKAREFYSPKYDASMPVNHPDLRSTIYWAPELVTGKDGNASIDFYNADGKGNYRVVVEGVDEKGNIGRRVYRYKVE